MLENLAGVTAPAESPEGNDVFNDSKWSGAAGQVWQDCQHAGSCQSAITLKHHDGNIIPLQDSPEAASGDFCGENRVLGSELPVQCKHIVQVGSCGQTCYGVHLQTLHLLSTQSSPLRPTQRCTLHPMRLTRENNE